LKTIELNKSFLDIPEHWNELTQKQLLQVMEILYLRNYKAEQMLLQLVKTMARLKNYQFFRCRPEDLEEYFYLLHFLLKPDFEFTCNHLPVYPFTDARGQRYTFYGPEDELGNLRMKEFTFTEDFYMQWFDSEKKDTEALDNLISILYRPGKKNYDIIINPEGDPREAFNLNICLHQAKRYIRFWPMSVKLAIATWYDGCRRFIVDGNPDVFSGGSGEPARYGLVSIMLNVAEGGVFGDFDKVEDQYVNLVMMQLNEVVDQGKRLKKAN
jgi:hypothetical protein